MNRTLSLTTLFFLSVAFSVRAQDSLMATLMKNETPVDQKTIATFKSTRIINAQTSETLHGGDLDFRITHRFGDFVPYGGDGRGGFHNFYGLDDPNFDIRIAFEYGITNRLMVGVSRSKQNENLEGLIKFRLLEQTENNKIPVSVTLFASTAYTPMLDPDSIYKSTVDRFENTGQVIIARKFSSKFSLEVIPSWVHRNVITNPLDNGDIFSIGGGGRWKFTKSMALIADYFYNFRNAALNGVYYNPLGVGIEIETGGHVFSLMFTNAQDIIEPEFITNTTDSWLKGGWKFGFNISRIFPLKKTESEIK